MFSNVDFKLRTSLCSSLRIGDGGGVKNWIFVGVWCHCKFAVIFATTLMVVAAAVDKMN